MPGQSALNLVPSYQNLVVLQTMSKAFGLAGIRLGFAISSNTHLIQIMNNVKAPYNINQLTSDLAVSVLSSESALNTMRTHLSQILSERLFLEKSLAALPFVTKVYPSDANFILFRIEHSAHEAYKIMADTGAVVTRFRGTEIHCEECIRVTVGTPEENKAFLEQLTYAWDKINQLS
jgi:histidinol-phosphate aminotransferase